MALRVKDILGLNSLKNATLIAGKGGLSHKIEKVSVLEIPFNTDQTFSMPLKSGSYELVISALYSVIDNPKAQLKIIENLSYSDCSGLILCYVDTWMKTISQEFIDLADSLNFPIIVASNDILYSDIITDVMEKVLSLQNREMKYAYEIHNEMTRAILQSHDSGHLIEILHNMLKHSVLLYTTDEQFFCSSDLHFSADELLQISELIKTQVSLGLTNEADPIYPSAYQGHTLFISPIFIYSVYYGTIVIFDMDSFSDLNQIALQQAKTTIATITANQIKVKQLMLSRQKSYLHNLMYWNFDTDTQAIVDGHMVNLSVEQLRLTLAVDLFIGDPEETLPSNEDLLLYKKIYREIQKELECSQIYHLSYKRRNQIFIMIGSINEDIDSTYNYAGKLAERLHQSILRFFKRDVYIGISDYFDKPSEVKNSCEEAVAVLKLAKRLLTPLRIFFYHDYAFLCQTFDLFYQNRATLLPTVQKMFEPLRAYDKENSTELYPTFCALIRNEFITQTTADELFIHKNTLLQRKHKIESLLSINPFVPPFSFQYQFAYLLLQFTNEL